MTSNSVWVGHREYVWLQRFPIGGASILYLSALYTALNMFCKPVSCSKIMFSLLLLLSWYCLCYLSYCLRSRRWRGRRRRHQTDWQQDEAQRVCRLLLQHKQKESVERHQPGVLRRKARSLLHEVSLMRFGPNICQSGKLTLLISASVFLGQDEQYSGESTDCAAVVLGRKLLAKRRPAWEAKSHKILSHLCQRQLHRLSYRVRRRLRLVPRP